MQNLLQFGMGFAERPSSDGHDVYNSWMLERIAQGVPTNHSGRADDDEALRTDQFRHDGMSQADAVCVSTLVSRVRWLRPQCWGHMQMLHQVTDLVSRAKDRFCGQQEPQQATDRIYVDAPVWLFAKDRLRGHVCGRPHGHRLGAGGREIASVLAADEPKIKHFNKVVFDANATDVDVRWLDVAMNETHAVRLGQ